LFGQPLHAFNLPQLPLFDIPGERRLDELRESDHVFDDRIELLELILVVNEQLKGFVLRPINRTWWGNLPAIL
jgi:hypothetical protein